MHLTLPSQGEAIEAYILKPFTPKASEKRSRLPPQREFQDQWYHEPVKKTGSGYSDPVSATMPLEFLESPARLFLRKVEAKGSNCFANSRLASQRLRTVQATQSANGGGAQATY